MAETRPQISEKLLDAFAAWIGLMHSGASPKPYGHALGSLESNAASEKYNNDTADVREIVDMRKGQKAENAFRALTPEKQTCIKTHIIWSWCSPLIGLSTDWAKQRKDEARHSAMTEEAYEINLRSALAELERTACV